MNANLEQMREAQAELEGLDLGRSGHFEGLASVFRMICWTFDDQMERLASNNEDLKVVCYGK